MLQRSEKGKIARRYFLELEQAWNTPEQVFARALKMADREIEKLKASTALLLQDVTRMKPKEVFADAVSTSHSSILIGDLAKILKQNGVETGQKRLFDQLRQEGYLIKNGSSKNLPTQKSMEMGLFEVKETAITNPDGSVRSRGESNPEDHRAAGLCRPQNCRIKQKSPGGCRGSLSLSCICWLL